jgi:hypothetical protein
MGDDGRAVLPLAFPLGALGIGAHAQSRLLSRRQRAGGSGGFPADFRAGLEVVDVAGGIAVQMPDIGP